MTQISVALESKSRTPNFYRQKSWESFNGSKLNARPARATLNLSDPSILKLVLLEI